MTMQKASQDQLKQFISQIERLEEEKKALGDDIKDKFAEAKAVGFDPKIMKKVIALRKKPKAERTEEEQLIETYLHALEGARSGADTPMGRSWSDDGEEARA